LPDADAFPLIVHPDNSMTDGHAADDHPKIVPANYAFF
jgi:hypothetical protein